MSTSDNGETYRSLMANEPKHAGEEPAFPVIEFNSQTGDIQYMGLTVRDFFAAKALPGLLRGSTWADVRDGADECAQAAYALADAMLKARSQ
jgi:hypothetical protein